MTEYECEYTPPASMSANYDLECGKPAKFRLTTFRKDRIQKVLYYYACDREHANLLKADLAGIGVDTLNVELIPV